MSKRQKRGIVILIVPPLVILSALAMFTEGDTRITALVFLGLIVYVLWIVWALNMIIEP